MDTVVSRRLVAEDEDASCFTLTCPLTICWSEVDMADCDNTAAPERVASDVCGGRCLAVPTEAAEEDDEEDDDARPRSNGTPCTMELLRVPRLFRPAGTPPVEAAAPVPDVLEVVAPDSFFTNAGPFSDFSKGISNED